MKTYNETIPCPKCKSLETVYLQAKSIRGGAIKCFACHRVTPSNPPRYRQLNFDSFFSSGLPPTWK